jgi:hypothetical protein
MSTQEERLASYNINVEELITALALSIKPFTVFTSGSVTDGFRHALSDLDVFVVYADSTSNERSDFAWETHTIAFEWVADWRIDVEYWNKNEIFAAAERLNQCPIEDWNACRRISLSDLHIAQRVDRGIPIIAAEQFEELRAAFNFKRVCDVIVSRCLSGYEGVAEDLAGAIESQQSGMALMSAREAMGLAIDAHLATRGETNIKPKWRFEKLKKWGEDRLLERYWALELPCLTNLEDVIPYAKDALAFANELILSVQKLRAGL